MSQLFSTELLAAADRIDAWEWNAQQICGDCRIRLPKSSFHGAIEIRHVGGLPLTRFSSSPLSFWKRPIDTANSQNRSCIVITQIAGFRRYLQGDAEVLLRPGDSTVIDSAHPWSSVCGTDCARLYVRVPRWMMEDRLQTREIPTAKRITGGTSFGANLSRLSQFLYDEADWMDEAEGAIALDTYFEALTACFCGNESSGQNGMELSGRVLRFIDAHLSEPTLGPRDVASAMGISVRHLHRVFSGTGSTFCDYVRVQRLEQCRDDLASPRLQGKTITEIAFRRGFSDAAHFSHSFRRRFGVSARAFRARAATSGERMGSCEHDDLLRRHLPEYLDSRPN